MRTVCFVKHEARIRIYKEAKALKTTGNYKLRLICEKCDYPLLKDVFDEILFYGFLENKDDNIIARGCNYGLNKAVQYGEKKLKAIVSSIDADIFHAHAEPNSVPRTVIENSDKPTVFDAQDFAGISCGIENLDKTTKEDEKYCFEHADGICRKGPPYETDYYRKYGYKIDCPELQWLDYCDEDLFVDINAKKLSEEDGEFHLVHTGTISTDPLTNSFKYLIPLGKELAKQRIHLHIYPNPLEYNIAKEYIELDSKEKYFHFHKPIPYSEVNQEISKYDYGLLILRQINGKIANTEKFKVGHGNKTFSYLEAGLPEIASDFLLNNNKTILDYGAGFTVNDTDLSRLGKILEKANYDELRKNVSKARQELSLRSHAHELEEFYKKLMDKTPNQLQKCG